MEIEISKHVNIKSKTPKGLDIKLSGSIGMFNLEIGKRKIEESCGNYFYTEELDSIVECLVKFKEILNTKQEI